MQPNVDLASTLLLGCAYRGSPNEVECPPASQGRQRKSCRIETARLHWPRAQAQVHGTPEGRVLPPRVGRAMQQRPYRLTSCASPAPSSSDGQLPTPHNSPPLPLLPLAGRARAPRRHGPLRPRRPSHQALAAGGWLHLLGAGAGQRRRSPPPARAASHRGGRMKREANGSLVRPHTAVCATRLPAAPPPAPAAPHTTAPAPAAAP